MEVFQAVATLKSFGRAAEALHMTQSAVSQRIASLEAELGGRLLDRTNRGAALTPKGQALLGYAETLLATRTEMVQTLADTRAEGRMVRLGVSETLAQTWLPTFIGAVSARYPFITFEIEVDVSSNLRARVVRQEIDLAFLLGRVVEPGIGSIDLCSYPLRFVASAFLAFDETPVTPAAMARHAMICFPRSTVLYAMLQRIFQERSIRMPQIHCSSSVATIIKMTLDRIGISMLTPVLIEAELADGRLVVLDTPVALPRLDYGAAYIIGPGTELLATIAQIASKVAKEYASTHKVG